MGEDVQGKKRPLNPGKKTIGREGGIA